MPLDTFAGPGSAIDRCDPGHAELYEGLLRLHILPALGALELARLTPPKIRAWYRRPDSWALPGRPTAAKAYRLLRTICGTAVTDGIIAANPCDIDGAGPRAA